MKTKLCKQCNQELPTTDFYRGVSSCKKCHSKRVRSKQLGLDYKPKNENGSKHYHIIRTTNGQIVSGPFASNRIAQNSRKRTCKRLLKEGVLAPVEIKWLQQDESGL